MTEEKLSLPVIDAYEIEAKAPPSDGQLKGVRDHAAALWKARRLLTSLSKSAAKVALEIEVLETKTLPDAMREIGMRRFELEGGFEAARHEGDDVAGAVEEDRRVEQLALALAQHGADDITAMLFRALRGGG